MERIRTKIHNTVNKNKKTGQRETVFTVLSIPVTDPTVSDGGGGGGGGGGTGVGTGVYTVYVRMQ